MRSDISDLMMINSKSQTARHVQSPHQTCPTYQGLLCKASPRVPFHSNVYLYLCSQGIPLGFNLFLSFLPFSKIASRFLWGMIGCLYMGWPGPRGASIPCLVAWQIAGPGPHGAKGSLEPSSPDVSSIGVFPGRGSHGARCVGAGSAAHHAR
jgi:hypothetical protein